MPAVEFAKSLPESLSVDSSFGLIQGRSQLARVGFEGCRVNQYGQAKGRLVPVTLSVLCSLLGTKYLPDFNGAVLVVEDVNEAPYRIDSYLNQLRLSGVLGGLSALVFGDFKNCGDESEQSYIINKYKSEVKGPVLSGLPFGHCDPRLSLPVGDLVELDVRESGIGCNL